MTLPAAYVAEHVELGYATTAHRAQGRTVDTAHAFVDITTTREALHVMATRGREVNQIYVNTAVDHDETDKHDAPEDADAVEVLHHALHASDLDQSAYEVAEIEAAREGVTEPFGRPPVGRPDTDRVLEPQVRSPGLLSLLGI